MRFPRHLIGGQGAVVDVIERARTGPSMPAGRYFAPPKCHPLITVAHETHQFPAGHLARTQPAGLRHVDGDVATPSSQILPLKHQEPMLLRAAGRRCLLQVADEADPSLAIPSG